MPPHNVVLSLIGAGLLWVGWFVSVPAALGIGLVSGLVCYLAVSRLKAHFGYDDSLDVFGVHGVGSTLGLLAVGLLADAAVNPAIATTFQVNAQVQSLAGGLGQLANQLKAVLVTATLAAVATFVLLKVVDRVIGLRVSEENETVGLDLSQHGESAYND